MTVLLLVKTIIIELSSIDVLSKALSKPYQKPFVGRTLFLPMPMGIADFLDEAHENASIKRRISWAEPLFLSMPMGIDDFLDEAHENASIERRISWAEPLFLSMPMGIADFLDDAHGKC